MMILATINKNAVLRTQTFFEIIEPNKYDCAVNTCCLIFI